jgi:hypothetical protein
VSFRYAALVKEVPMPAIHVSPRGDDRADGSAAHPFATLAHALAAARAAGVHRVVLHGGSYFETSVTLTAADSGLVLEAAPGETPVLYGGRRLTGWRKNARGWYTLALPEVKAGTWDFRHLVVNGRLCPRARLPETGVYTHESVFDVQWMSTTGGGWQRKPTADELTHLVYRAGDLGRWLDLRNAELTIYHQWDESVVGVKTLDDTTRTVTFSTPAGHPPGAFGSWNAKAKTYVVWNVVEGMTRPGQWYLDRTQGTLVYWPLPGETMRGTLAIAPTATRIIRLQGASDAPVRDVTLRGLTLAVTTTPLVAGGFAANAFDGAVSGDHVQGCAVRDCTITTVGGHAIKFSHGERLRVSGCEIAETGGGGVYCRGTAVRISDNAIHHTGSTYPSATGMQIGGSDVLVSHNDIHDITYSGIGLYASDSMIEANRFHDVMTELSDGAAIYIGFCHDVTMRGNVVQGTAGGLTHAYYIDEQGTNCVVEGNLAINTHWPSHNHMAKTCTIRHNVFLDEGDMRLTFPRSHGFTFAGNILVAGGAITFQMTDDGIAAMPGNVLCSRAGTITVERLDGEGYGATKRLPLAPRDGTRFADPAFTNAPAGDYTYRPGSPALALNLPVLDVSDAGKRPHVVEE